MLGTKLPCKGLDSISRKVLRGERRGTECRLPPPALWARDEAKVAPLYIVLGGLEPGGRGWHCWDKTADLSSGGLRGVSEEGEGDGIFSVLKSGRVFHQV